MRFRSGPVVMHLALGGLLAGLAACDPAARAEARPSAAQERSPIAACFLLASEATSLLDAQVFELCRGTFTPTGPVECYLAADERLTISEPRKVDLCQCAESDEPVECWEVVSEESSLLDAQIERLCAPRLAYGLLPNCRPAGYTY